jgi:hypothetical protein
VNPIYLYLYQYKKGERGQIQQITTIKRTSNGSITLRPRLRPSPRTPPACTPPPAPTGRCHASTPAILLLNALHPCRALPTCLAPSLTEQDVMKPRISLSSSQACPGTLLARHNQFGNARMQWLVLVCTKIAEWGRDS